MDCIQALVQIGFLPLWLIYAALSQLIWVLDGQPLFPAASIHSPGSLTSA